MLISGIIFALSSIVLISIAQEPMALLKSEQPNEYKRVGGSLAPVLMWSWLTFSFYLAIGDFKKNINSEIIVEKFTSSMWAARIQLVSLLCFVLFWLIT